MYIFCYMQSSRDYIQDFINSRSKLFAIITALLVTLLAIRVIPHILHPSMIYHNIPHIVSLISIRIS
jgi:hypothetical protein